MKRTLFLTFFMTLTSLLLVPLAFAKGSPDKITIWGPSLAKAMEITDPETLKGFDPWNGQFLDRSSGVIEDEPRSQEIYTVVFYLRDNKGEERIFYVFQYSPNPFGEPGFIYLPREGEPWHLMNGQTIVRTSGWHYASAEWDTFLQSTLEQNRVSPIETVISPDLQLAVPITILLGSAVMIWYLRRRQPVSIQHQ
jgi:hypothetical protein